MSKRAKKKKKTKLLQSQIMQIKLFDDIVKDSVKHEVTMTTQPIQLQFTCKMNLYKTDGQTESHTIMQAWLVRLLRFGYPPTKLSRLQFAYLFMTCSNSKEQPSENGDDEDDD